MKTNPKSNYKQSNNRQSIRTRKNKKVGKRRTMKGGGGEEKKM